MVSKKIIGLLILIVATTYIMITLEGQPVRLKIGTASTTFYTQEGGAWVVSGVEVFNLYNGTKKLTKNETTLFSTNISGIVWVLKTMKYPSGQVINQFYYFNASDSDVRNFPIKETVEVLNADGMILRYDATKLVYSGTSYKLKDETELTFGRSIKIEFPSGYSSGNVYSSGGVRLNYKITSNSQEFRFRMYDPPVKIDLYTNGTWTNKTIESNEPINITAKSNVTNLTVCLSVNHSYLGENFTCNETGTIMYYWNPSCSILKFNDSTTSKNVNFTTIANQTVYYRFHSEDEVNTVRMNLTGINTSGSNWPANVRVFVNNTLAVSIPGTLKEGASSLSTFNDSVTSKNISLSSAGSQTAYLKFNKGAVITDAYANISGYPNRTLDIDGTTQNLGGNLVYDYVYIHNGGKLNINGTGWLNITAKNITIDSTSWINATMIGGRGGSTNAEPDRDAEGLGAGLNGDGGGGAGYGGNGGSSYCGGSYDCNQGSSYGSSNGVSIEMGSGGGGGSRIEPNSAGDGGNGGGLVLLNATYITITGNITVNGWSGSGTSNGGGGGGGSGGGILLVGKTINLDNGELYASAGAGGSSSNGNGGGGGGGGRIKVFYSSSFSNTSSTTSVAAGAAGGSTGGGYGGEGGAAGTAYYNQTTLNYFIDAQQVYFDVEGDGDKDYSYNWTSFGPVYFTNAKSGNLSAAFNHYLSLCTQDSDGNCNVPFVVGSNSSGTFNVSSINISYTVYFNPITIGASLVQTYLNSSAYGFVNVPIKIEANQGNVSINGTNISYNGSCVLNVTAMWAGNATYPAASNVTYLNITRSKFTLRFPYSFMVEPIFLPLTNSSKNVSMYGQSATVPGYNITGKNYAINFNVSIRLNQSMNSCMNMTVGTSNSVYNFTLNTTRRQILSNITYNQSAGLWLKLNMYNCTSSYVYRNWWIELDTCCMTCMRCW